MQIRVYVTISALRVQHSTASALIRGWRRNATSVHCVRMLLVVVMAMQQLPQSMKHSHYCMHKMTWTVLEESLMPVKFSSWYMSAAV